MSSSKRGESQRETVKSDATLSRKERRAEKKKQAIDDRHQKVVKEARNGDQIMDDSGVSSSRVFIAPVADTGRTGDGRDWTKPWKQQPNRGAYTGAPRAPYPRVHRPFGANTRQRVVGDRSHITHMRHGGYGTGIVESKSVPPLLAPHATLGQSGAASLTSAVPAFRPGSAHLLFTSR